MTTAIEGTVRQIRYVNEDNFWTVAGMSATSGGPLVTIVGAMPGVVTGMKVRVEGQWHDDKRYGRQLKVERFEQVVPATEKGLVGYLSSGVISGIGPKMAERLVGHFGTETLDVILQHPERLAEVPGVGAKRVASLVESLRERHAAQQALIFLFGLGIPRGVAMRIYKRYKDETVTVVRKHPYRLAEDVHGVGFHKADQVAKGLDIAGDDPGRVRAGVYHCLRVARDDGHCFLRAPDLISAASDLLNVANDHIPDAVQALVRAGKAVVAPGPPDEPDAVYLTPLYEAEATAAEHLAALHSAAHAAPDDPAKRVSDAAAALEIDLAPGQLAAAERALCEPVILVTGGPGTGKTTLIRTLLFASPSPREKVALAAPTGRAAKRMSEATGHPAQTLHRLLEFSPMENRFQRDEDDPLTAELVIVDEASMIDVPLLAALVRAIAPGTQLVLVGDADQLPPVGPGSPLVDLIRGGQLPVARLSRIFRQGADSAIVEAAHTINRGGLPTLTPSGTPLQDFYFIARDSPEAVRATIEALVTKRIPERFGLDPVRDVQVLSPMRAGPLGIQLLNERLQALLNPPPAGKETEDAAARGGPAPFRRGDKVMQLRNDYDRGVFNGDLGVVTGADSKTGALRVVIDDREIDYDRASREDLVLAYAITVHKSQGSEYPAVVIPITTQHFKMLRRNLIYTAITRGQRLVVLVGSLRAMRIAVGNSDVAARNSWIDTRLAAALDRHTAVA